MNQTVILAIICVTCTMGYELSDNDYASKVLQQCADQLYDLTMCIRQQRSSTAKLTHCDRQLAQTFVCMSISPEPEDKFESESLFAHARTEDDLSDESFVVKRGLGRCIHKCLRGDGKMNFIQCKSMCHK